MKPKGIVILHVRLKHDVAKFRTCTDQILEVNVCCCPRTPWKRTLSALLPPNNTNRLQRDEKKGIVQQQGSKSPFKHKFEYTTLLFIKLLFTILCQFSIIGLPCDL